MTSVGLMAADRTTPGAMNVTTLSPTTIAPPLAGTGISMEAPASRLDCCQGPSTSSWQAEAGRSRQDGVSAHGLYPAAIKAGCWQAGRMEQTAGSGSFQA